MRAALIIIIVAVFAFSNLIAEEDTFNMERLPIGNPQTKYDFCAVKLNKVFDSNANTDVRFEQLIEKLRTYRIIMLGESHTNEQHHTVQLNVIKGLVAAGEKVCLALEMFNPAQNQVLANYISSQITEEEFLDQSDYFNTWGHNYRYYQPIFDYARTNQVKMFGVNTKHEYTSKIGRGGIQSLSSEEQAAIPEIDTTNVEHRFYIKAAMEGMDAVSPAQFRNIYAAQCVWDATMGEGAIKVARENPESIVLILVGSGHVAYNLAIGNIINKRSEFPFASVIAVDIADTVKESVMMQVKKSLDKDKKEASDKKAAPAEKKMPPMSMTHGGGMNADPYKIVARSLADFLWGVPEQKQEKYPSFGFSVDEKGEKGFSIKRVIPKTLAEEKGIMRGDIILAIDEKDFANMVHLKKYLSFKNWGDEIDFRILRDEKELNLKFKIEDSTSR
ncbi:ChaN family lipoprotein [candidate division KSB1 bacterium]|nr:ChaN family lipoprotein [candidate division KSB1 bacterium]